jgi:hypothetical protein
MTKRSSILFLSLLVVNAAVFHGAFAFSSSLLPLSHDRLQLGRSQQSFSKVTSSPRQHGLSSTKTTRLQVVSADVEADLDMPELGNDGVYHIMDERQYK